MTKLKELKAACAAADAAYATAWATRDATWAADCDTAEAAYDTAWAAYDAAYDAAYAAYDAELKKTKNGLMTNMITAISEALRRRRNINNTIKELHRLSDSELHDIGIHRAQIETVAHGLIDIHRAVRDTNNNG